MNLGRQISALKGLHPGIFLERELQKRKLPKGRFAISIGEYPQTLGAITKGHRDMNTSLALKIERALELDEGFLMILQTFYEIGQIKQEESGHARPDLKKFRKAIFWDTELEKINWMKQKKAIIKRIFERGSDEEKQEITRFYGKAVINQVLTQDSIHS